MVEEIASKTEADNGRREGLGTSWDFSTPWPLLREHGDGASSAVTCDGNVEDPGHLATVVEREALADVPNDGVAQRLRAGGDQ